MRFASCKFEGIRASGTTHRPRVIHRNLPKRSQKHNTKFHGQSVYVYETHHNVVELNQFDHILRIRKCIEFLSRNVELSLLKVAFSVGHRVLVMRLISSNKKWREQRM